VEDRQRRLLGAVGRALPDGEDQDAESHRRRDHQHQRRQPVDDEHDPERHRPAPDRDRGGALRVGLQEQGDRHGQDGGQHQQAQRALRARVPADQQRPRGAEQRQQDRQGC
jgi:hypothetical protein